MNKKIFSILIAAAIFSNTGVLAVNTANERSSNGESVLSGGDKSSNNNLTESLTEDLEEDLPVDNNPPAAPTELLTNELERPLNAENISFRWVVNDMDLDEVQTAYEMIVTDGVTGETVWDSGKVSSSEQSNVLYDGETLKEGYPYKWKVKTWDKNDEQSPYSEEAEFASGISDENWDAYWISDGTGGAKVTQGKYNHYWYVRGEGEIDGEKEIAKVLGYFSAEQDYKLYVNNEEIGRGQSFDYASETRYQGWDITEAAKKNPSKLTVGALVRTYGPGQGRAATDAGFIGRINVYYTDGTSTVINTDKDWKVSKTVPLSGTARRNGEGDFVEEYNAANAQDDFTSSEYDISSWSSVSVLGRNTTGAVTAMYPELSKTNAGEVHPVSVKKLSDGTVVADFGRVIPARAVIKFSNGKAGNKVTLLGGYVLKSDGTIDSSKNQSTDMRWIYTQKDGEQVYKTWDHLAFRYISISGSDEKLAEDSISAELVYTDAPIQYKSTLITSNSVLNSVYDLMQNSALYSIQNSFVDTPTREKGQFLQDAINISEASTATLYERAASKKAIEQFMASADRYWTGDETGRLNSVYPNGDGKRDIPDFTVNFPYWVYNYYMETGDKDLLKRAYPYVKNTADYISRYISADTGLVTKLGGGD